MLWSALPLAASFVALARAQRLPNAPAARLRRIGWLLLAASAALAWGLEGWRGTMAWLGLVPLAAGAIMIAQACRKTAAGRP